VYVKTKFGIVLAALALSTGASGHGGSDGKRSQEKAARAVEETAFGRPGERKKVNRTIRVTMHDEMQFMANGPGVKRAGSRKGSDDITVQQGDTVRFVVANKGKVMHEMVIGTLAELKEHAELMRRHPGMEHDEPYMAHVSPSKTGDIVWQFTKPGEFHYACLVAGHFEAGMIGKITVTAGARK
jgi:uncharacterized cupredoxin-like copper-binding protein